MLKFKLKRIYHKLFPKLILEEVNIQISKRNCQYWKNDIMVKYSPFYSAQDVFKYLKDEEYKRTHTRHSSVGGCGGGCIGGCGGGCN